LTNAVTGKPVAVAKVACGAVFSEDGKGGGSNAVTDADGRYRLSVPSPGIYLVWLKRSDREPTKTAVADDGLLVEAGKVTKSALVLQEGRKVQGTVVDAKGKGVANLTVMCHSPARPQDATALSATTRKDGTFEFYLPPGRAYLYTNQLVARTEENPFGVGDSAQALVTVSATEDAAPIKLTLQPSNPRFGDPSWVDQSTPGTQIVRRVGNQHVTGTVVDPAGKPISGAVVFKEDGPLVKTNEKGEFRVETLKGTQFIMHAFAPGHRLWFGTPTSGDVLKIVLQPKASRKPVPPDSPE
jgi:hypothetical protein